MANNPYHHQILTSSEIKEICNLRDSSLATVKEYTSSLALSTVFYVNFAQNFQHEYGHKQGENGHYLRDARKLFGSFPNPVTQCSINSLDTLITEGMECMFSHPKKGVNSNTGPAFLKLKTYKPKPSFYLNIGDLLIENNTLTANQLAHAFTNKRNAVYMDHIKRTGDSYNHTSAVAEIIIPVVKQLKKLETTIVTYNRKMANSIATSLGNEMGVRIDDRDDLENLALIGLLEGYYRYNPNRGGAFYTYVQHWVKNSIRKGYSNSSTTIRLPVTLHTRVALVNRTVERLYHENGNISPTDDDVCDELNISKVQLKAVNGRGQISYSLDQRIGDDDTQTYGSIHPSDAFEKQLHNEEMVFVDGLMQKILPVLDSRELEVIYRRFGFNGYKKTTLEKVGQIYKVSRERISQIEKKGIRKLRIAVHTLMMENPEYMVSFPNLPLILRK